ncbi:glutamate--cysteine ligase [Actinocorallia sp. A-T 12471]|uniref:carboxylate-amine ligase n=1 Tax=Actinocorallia sp. A-T 12471 TaxID=3089813 RepID=UPI0029D126E4|nr:glutamate--cysteine ligase [Actinocorallia sp. A-T 12471]MDX6742342.1 glutamate--cysteine ligase [Actinocorallia sp. A-T 12471]
MPVFGEGAARTVGVEEEFLLADPATGRTAARAPDVLARASDLTSAARRPADAAFHGELLATQVESVTGVHRDLAGLRSDLVFGRLALAEAAADHGLLLVSSGTAVVPSGDPPPTPGERFDRIAGMYGEVIRRYEVCGCHVHVGVPDRDTAVAVVNHLRPWLPALLALSANSPYRDGRDTGYASWRMLEQAHFPGGGPPPHFTSAADHDAEVARLVACGVLADATMTFWTARPSPRYPTVEVRAADAAATVDDAVLQAALTRGLVTTALTELAAGREAQPLDPQICAAAQWTAARHGISGDAVDPVRARRVPAHARIADLLTTITPALDESGDLALVRALLQRVKEHGSGADRQRAAGADGPLAVVADLAARTVPADAHATTTPS